jgi:hypothetical protein
MSEDLGALINQPKYQRATFCSSSDCQGKSSSKRGALVHNYAHKEICPKCGKKDYLYHGRVKFDTSIPVEIEINEEEQ